MPSEQLEHLQEIKLLLQKKLEQAQHSYYTLALESDKFNNRKIEDEETAIFIEEMYENKARLTRIIEEILNNLRNIEKGGGLVI